MALPAAQAERTEFHLATDDVRRVAPERILQRMGKIHVGKPLATKSRRELLASLRPNYLKHLRADNGDLPEGWSNDREVFPFPKRRWIRRTRS